MRTENLTGRRFGLWTVLGRGIAPPRAGSGRPAYWLCVCSCGLKKAVEGGSLRKGRSLGCRHCKNHLEPHRATFNLLAGSASRRGFECMSFEEFKIFTEAHECFYCGESLAWPKHDVAKNGQGYNLDRKDNSKGYTFENCVPCCWNCNLTKGNRLTFQEMVAVGSMRRHNRQFVAPTS